MPLNKEVVEEGVLGNINNKKRLSVEKIAYTVGNTSIVNKGKALMPNLRNILSQKRGTHLQHLHHHLEYVSYGVLRPKSNHITTPSTDFRKYAKHNVFINKLMKHRNGVIGAV